MKRPWKELPLCTLTNALPYFDKTNRFPDRTVQFLVQNENGPRTGLDWPGSDRTKSFQFKLQSSAGGPGWSRSIRALVQSWAYISLRFWPVGPWDRTVDWSKPRQNLGFFWNIFCLPHCLFADFESKRNNTSGPHLCLTSSQSHLYLSLLSSHFRSLWLTRPQATDWNESLVCRCLSPVRQLRLAHASLPSLSIILNLTRTVSLCRR